jgi:ribokinase
VIISFIVIVVSSSSSTPSSSSSVLVVGSINADIIVPIDRFPKPGETIVCPQNHPHNNDAGKTIAGGKGANQATAIARLNERSIFVCQFGNDANALMLEKVLNENNVDISFSKKCDKPSGLGLVMLERDGSGSAIVVGGANAEWPDKDVIVQNIKTIFT